MGLKTAFELTGVEIPESYRRDLRGIAHRCHLEMVALLKQAGIELKAEDKSFTYDDKKTFVPPARWTPYLKKVGLPKSIVGSKLKVCASKSSGGYMGTENVKTESCQFETKVVACQIVREYGICLKIEPFNNDGVEINELIIFTCQSSSKMRAQHRDEEGVAHPSKMWQIDSLEVITN